MSSLPRLSNVLVSLVLWPLRVLEARATMRRLAALDARMLADIGLTPADVQDATALPLAVDPGFFLAGRAADKRAVRTLSGGRPRRAWRRPALSRAG